MIQQAGVGLASREDANPYYENGYLPLIAAPMSAVIGDYFPTVLDKHKIQYVIPRNYRPIYSDKWFTAIGLEEFEQLIQRDINTTIKVCIDVANGNNPRLHAAIREGKSKHGDKLFIMSGNVSSLPAFKELARAGCDMIRVGIGGGCLAADSRILMANGQYKNIADLQIGDYVINKDGYPVKVIKTIYSGKKKVSKLKHNAFYKPLIITNDHQVRVSDLSSYKRSYISSKGYKALFKEDIWKPISNSIGDNLLCPTKIQYQLSNDFNINLNQFDSDKSKNVAGNIKPSYDLGYIFGTFLGDGCITLSENFYEKRNSINKIGSVHWAFGKNEDNIVLALVDCIENVFREKCSYKRESNKIIVNLYRKWIANLFSEFYTAEGHKQLPAKWYCLNDDYLHGLYDGLIDSDGYKEATRHCFENTSPYLIELIYFIKSNLDQYFPNTEQRKKTCGKLKNCNENNLKQSYSLRTLSNYLARQTENFNLLKVTHFENEVDEVDTYDIEVDCSTHSFIANNCIVHNSGCNTSTQTGVGQPDLEELIEACADNSLYYDYPVQIIADGITTYMNQLISKQECLENGYAAINRLLYKGASYVMLGKIFAQCIEADTTKTVMHRDCYIDEVQWVTEFAKGDSTTIKEIIEKAFKDGKLYADYYGMASIRGQKTYLKDVKPSEGKSLKILVKWTLEEWLHGNNTDELPGFVNMLKSAMSYTGSKTLNEFIW